MPLGIERINVRTAQPNPNINFIKPLEGSDKAFAQDYLERVAAICVPIMKRNHVYVMSLEEFPPNSEFLGRNFNAGEKIQLVLKNKMGGWFPFKFVQRVMMHELAHCKQMNHSKSFWQVNNQHCAELKELWDRGYTGEGMWSRGLSLESGKYVRDRPLMEGEMPEHLCGGTFRSNRKRKRGAPEREKISYQERQQRRIAKKFGTNGVTLGADAEVKAKLEKGKRPIGKPRVAGSLRGRELRAAAALARFEQPPVAASGSSDAEDSETESEEEDVKIKPDDAKDLNGTRLVDSNGRGMIKVCEDDHSNPDSRKEMEDLQNLEYVYGAPVRPTNGVQNMRNVAAELDSRTASFSSPYTSPWGDGSVSMPSYGYGESSKAARATEKGKENIKKAPTGYSRAWNTGNSVTGSSEFRSIERPVFAGAGKIAMQNKTKELHTKDPGNDIVKQEVFDILSDFLGDPTCNPEAAIYSGLDAAKSGMPKDNPEPEEESIEQAPTHVGSYHSPYLNSASSSRTIGKHLPQPAGTVNRGVKRDSRGFARAVESHRREETIGVRSMDPNPLNPSMNELGPEQQRRASLMGGISAGTQGLVEQIRQSQLNHDDTPASNLPEPPRRSSQRIKSRPQTNPITSVPAQTSNSTPYPSSQPTGSRTARLPPPNTQPPQVAHPPSRPVPAPRVTPAAPRAQAPPPPPPPPPVATSTTCKVCTTENESEPLVCMVCNNVLHPERDPFHWKCKSAVCQGSEYINSGDYGVCGVCGEKKPARN